MDKATLLNMLHSNRALFEYVVSQVSETQMIEPVGKDMLAYLTAWEQRVVQWLADVARGEMHLVTHFSAP